jgi:hypothetical protein
MSIDSQQKTNLDSTAKLLSVNKPDNNKQINPSSGKGIPSPFSKNKKAINYSKTNDSFKLKRFDRLGNEICKNGKQKVTFIDKVSERSLKEYINVENFKEYNKMEDINLAQHNGCCLIE